MAKNRDPHSNTTRFAPLFGITLQITLGLLLSGTLAEAQPRTVSISNGAGLPGSIITQQIRLSDLAGYAGGDFTIRFETDQFAVNTVTRTTNTSNFILSWGRPDDSSLSISMASAEGLTTAGEGTIAEIEIQVESEAISGASVVTAFQTARWYNELSQGEDCQAINPVLWVSDETPADQGLTVWLGKPVETYPDNYQTALWLGPRESVNSLSVVLDYPAEMLELLDFEPLPAFSTWIPGWSGSEGQRLFTLQGDTTLHGTEMQQLGTIVWRKQPGTPTSGSVQVDLNETTIKNSKGLEYVNTSLGVSIDWDSPLSPTTTPTTPPTTTLTPPPSVSSTPSPSPSQTETPLTTVLPTATHTETPMPSNSPTPTSWPDFNGNNKVDSADLLMLLRYYRAQEKQP